MFGRRRPLLGAAVVVGASRSAARHEVERQAQRNAEMQLAADRAADKQRREEDERDRRTQLAIDEAIAKERSRTNQAEEVPPYTKAITRERGINDQTEQMPSYTGYGHGVDEKKGANVRYCPECQHVCKREDKFCSRCGHKQPTDSGEQKQVE